MCYMFLLKKLCNKSFQSHIKIKRHDIIEIISRENTYRGSIIGKHLYY